MSMPTVETAHQDVDEATSSGIMPIRPNELPVGSFERQLSDEIVSFLKAEVAQHGDDVYYWFRQYYLEQDIGLAPYDIAVAKFVKKHAAGMRIIEIGAGMAELSALLAAYGFNATAIEKTPKHWTTANNLQTWLNARGYPAYYLVDGWFPDVGHNLTENAIVVGLSIIHSMAPDRWEALLDGFIGASGVIIDLCTFFAVRREPDLQADLVRQITARGFKNPVEIYSWKSGEAYNFSTGRVVYFERTT